MKKKVLFVINSLGLGGAEKSLISLLSAFDFNKYEVDLFMFSANGMFLPLLPKEVNVLPELDFLKNSSILHQIIHPKYLFSHISASIGLRINGKRRVLHDAQCYWKYAGKAFNSLDGYYDVAIAWGQGNPTHYIAEKVRAEKKIAFINADYESVGHKKEFDFPFYEKYSHIIAVSDELHEKIEKVFPEFKVKIKTIYDINNADLIYKMAEESNPFEKENIQFRIVTVGRLSYEKGYDLAIEAAKELKNKGISFKWFFVGDGVNRNSLERMVNELSLNQNIIFVGQQNNPYTYIKNSDIYVQTSRCEGYCLTLAEARILNKPIITTNFDVVYNQIRDKVNGLIVEMNGKSIANALIQVMEDSELRNVLVENLKMEKKGNTEEIDELYQIIDG